MRIVQVILSYLLTSTLAIAETPIVHNFQLLPIKHATAILKIDETVLHLDPATGADSFKNLDAPQIVLITDIHPDHLDIPTLQAVVHKGTTIVAPEAVYESLTEELKTHTKKLRNAESASVNDINITAVPMYNLRKEALSFHPKGRGNGYLLEKDGLRIYISGDTEDIPEMRALKDVDIALICMNLPYTMTVESAASAVLEFQPREVFPYHYRGKGGKSDIKKFKQLVQTGNPKIKVTQLEWYPE